MEPEFDKRTIIYALLCLVVPLGLLLLLIPRRSPQPSTDGQIQPAAAVRPSTGANRPPPSRKQWTMV